MSNSTLHGLPELPPKHFWRVTKGGYNYYVLWLMKNKGFFGCSEVFSRRIYDGYADYTLSECSIRRTADLIMEDFRELQEEIRNENKLLGDYPPKKLGE